MIDGKVRPHGSGRTRTGHDDRWDATDSSTCHEFLTQLRAFRARIVTQASTAERRSPETGNELRPFCSTILAIDRLRLEVEDLAEAV